METEVVLLDTLVSPPRNVRLHPDYQITELARAIEMFGQTRPMVIDETNTVLAGNGLLAALRSLGRTEGVAIRINGLSHDDRIKLMLSDNKIYSLGRDDFDGIMQIVRGLDDLDVPGFDGAMLVSLLASDDAAEKAKGSFEPRVGHTVVRRSTTHAICPYCGKETTIRRAS